MCLPRAETYRMFRNRAFQIVIMTVLFTAVMVGFQFATADDKPATTSSSTTTKQSVAATTKPADIAPDAKPLLEKLSAAYKNLKSLELNGTLAGDFEVDGQKSNEKVDVTASYAAPNQFRHA